MAELSLRTKWHVTWHLHVKSARCVARDLHTIAPGPLERTCWKQFAALWGDCKKSWIAPLNAIIIIIIILADPVTVSGKHFSPTFCQYTGWPSYSKWQTLLAPPLCWYTGWPSYSKWQTLLPPSPPPPPPLCWYTGWPSYSKWQALVLLHHPPPPPPLCQYTGWPSYSKWQALAPPPPLPPPPHTHTHFANILADPVTVSGKHSSPPFCQYTGWPSYSKWQALISLILPVYWLTQLQ